MQRIRLSALAIALASGLATSASAQTTTWVGSASSVWANAANWTAGIPSAALNAQIDGPPQAALTGTGSTADLLLTTAAASVVINGSSTLLVNGTTISNAGVITINPTGSAGDAAISFVAPACTISGTGSIVLNPTGGGIGIDANIVTSTATNVVTNSAGATIRGNGSISANIANAGVIAADITARRINLSGNPKSNSGQIVAQNGGTVAINNIAITQTPSGVIRADGANSLILASGSIANGTLESANGGVVRTAGTLTVTDMTLAGSIEVQGANTIAAQGSIINTGTITVNPSGSAADATLSFNSPAITLNGGGTIVLNPTGGGIGTDANIVTSTATNVVTNPASATIRGNGSISANIANAGIIAADITARRINLSGNPKSNSGQIVAQNGGTVAINNIAITQTPSGVIRADGANSLILASGSITNGTLESANGGVVQTAGVLTLDGVTCNGTAHIVGGDGVNVLSSLTNTGTITVNPSGSTSDATLSFNSPAITLNGGGTIVLNPTGGGIGTDANIVTSTATNVVTNPASATIRGNGSISANIANAGVIAADITARRINLSTNPKSNSGQIVAQNGGSVSINNIAITQTPSGVIRADGANSLILASGSITNGTLESANGGVVRTAGTLTLTDMTLAGSIEVQGGNTIAAQGSIINNARLTVNATASSVNSALTAQGSGLTLGGTGTVVLNAGTSIADAQLAGSSTTTLTQAPGHTLAGNGVISVKLDNSGIISPGQPSPGDPTQLLQPSTTFADIVCDSTSVVRIEVEGPAAGQFDRIAAISSGADFVCGGTLDVTHLNGFTGLASGTSIDLITTIAPGIVTGTFATTNLPPLPGTDRYVIAYLPQRVVLFATCYANCDGSFGTVLSPADFSCFLSAYRSGAAYANCDGSAGPAPLSPADFSCFLAKYRAGCP